MFRRIVRPVRKLLAPLTGSRTPARPYTRFTFASLGRIAKASGAVRAAHIRCAEQLIADLGFGAQDRRYAVAEFDAGKRSDFDFGPLARACHATPEDRDVLNELALESLCAMAWALGPPNDPCRAELLRLCGLLGIATPLIEAAAMRVNDYQRRRLPLNVQQAYQLLGLDHWADDAQLKLAYRRMIGRHHPDKLGVEASQRDTVRAREKSVAIRAAYELIRESRTAG